MDLDCRHAIWNTYHTTRTLAASSVYGRESMWSRKYMAEKEYGRKPESSRHEHRHQDGSRWLSTGGVETVTVQRRLSGTKQNHIRYQRRRSPWWLNGIERALKLETSEQICETLVTPTRSVKRLLPDFQIETEETSDGMFNGQSR